jgi:hypothetical protein
LALFEDNFSLKCYISFKKSKIVFGASCLYALSPSIPCVPTTSLFIPSLLKKASSIIMGKETDYFGSQQHALLPEPLYALPEVLADVTEEVHVVNIVFFL